MSCSRFACPSSACAPASACSTPSPAATSDPEKRAWLIERADGNPFFLEELIRKLRAGGDTLSLPDTVLGTIQARLDALGEDAKLLLRAASVFGEAFSSQGVEALLGEQAAALRLPGWLHCSPIAS